MGDLGARVDAVATSWWFGHLVILAVCATILAVAAVMTPTSEVVSLFGTDIPVMCTFRRLTGMGCPGCGLTRSFAFMADGAVLEAGRMNLLGPVLFTVVAFQVPYRVLRLLRGRRDRAVEAAHVG